LPIHKIKIFFNENNKLLDEFMDNIYNWAKDLSKNLINKFASSNNINISSKKNKKYNIRSKILNMS
jgi:hypothetical protein